MEFSFVSLSQLLIVLALLFAMYKAFKDAAVTAYNLKGDESDPVRTVFDKIRLKWAVAMVLAAILMGVNPIDFSVRDEANRFDVYSEQKGYEKALDLPPKVEVESRSLDDALNEFNAELDQTIQENETEQHRKLNQ